MRQKQHLLYRLMVMRRTGERRDGNEGSECALSTATEMEAEQRSLSTAIVRSVNNVTGRGVVVRFITGDPAHYGPVTHPVVRNNSTLLQIPAFIPYRLRLGGPQGPGNSDFLESI